jgi:hypothetical protein
MPEYAGLRCNRSPMVPGVLVQRCGRGFWGWMSFASEKGPSRLYEATTRPNGRRRLNDLATCLLSHAGPTSTAALGPTSSSLLSKVMRRPRATTIGRGGARMGEEEAARGDHRRPSLPGARTTSVRKRLSGNSRLASTLAGRCALASSCGRWPRRDSREGRPLALAMTA